MRIKNMKTYTLEVDLVQSGRYYLHEHTNTSDRTAIIVYHDFDLAKRILDILNTESENKKSV
jgi:hypothetical protein